MRRGLVLVVVACVLCLFVRPARSETQVAPDPATQARALLDDMVTERFAEAVARFDEKMTAAMPAAKLREVWRQVVQQAGAFRSVGGQKAQERSGYVVQVLSCEFATARIDVRVVIDKAGKVAGLFFAPAASTAAAAATPLPAGVTERPIVVGEGTAWALPGTFTRPAGNGPFPAVVLVHGSGPGDRDETVLANAPFRDLAIGLSERGVAVLRYDKRTRVHAAALEASFDRFTVNEETVADARAAIGLAAAQPDVAVDRVFVLGHSLGGMLVPRIAAGHPTLAGAIVMAGAARPIEDLVVEQYEYLTRGNQSPEVAASVAEAREAARRIKAPGLKPGERIALAGVPMPASYWLDLRGYQPATAAAALDLPLLVLQGGRDYQVRTTDFDLWKAALTGRRTATCKLYPDLNHLFISGTGPSTPAEYQKPGRVATEVLDDIAAWVRRQQRRKQ